MAAIGQAVSIATAPSLIFRVVDPTTYKANGYTRAANPNIFISGSATDELPLLLVFTTADTVYLGGSEVTSSGTAIGAKVTGIASLAYNCVGGDSLYGVVASGTSSVSVLALRQDEVVAPTFALVGHSAASSANGNTAVTPAIDTRGANLLAVALVVATGVTVTLTDSAANSWSTTTRITGASADCLLFYCASPTTSATHTFTATTTAGLPSLCVEAFSGAALAPLDQQNGAAVTGTSHATGSITPTQNGCVIIAVDADFTAGTQSWTVNSGMTITDQQPGTPSFGLAMSMAYKIQTASVAINATWTITTSTTGATKIASFTP